MIRLVPIDGPATEPTRRLWLVFFGEAKGMAWWAYLCRPGFRHVRAAAWYDREQRWVFFDPARRGTGIALYTAEEFGPRFTELLENSTAVLRVASRFDRTITPPVWHCVGSIKALLGVRSCALSPFGLFRHLLRTGAETVEVPEGVRDIRQRTTDASTPSGAGGRS